MLTSVDRVALRSMSVSLTGQDYDSMESFKATLDMVLSSYFDSRTLSEYLIDSIDDGELVLCAFAPDLLQVELYLPDLPAKRYSVTIDDDGQVTYCSGWQHIPITVLIGIRYQIHLLTGV